MGVYKEGKNWKVQVYYKDWQGNQKRKQKRGFRTKGEAKEWERDFLQQQSQGVDIEFGNFLEIYYKDMDVRLREHTMYTKRRLPACPSLNTGCPFSDRLPASFHREIAHNQESVEPYSHKYGYIPFAEL